MSDDRRSVRTALLTIDLQNDFLHPEGAYGRAGQTAESISALPARIRPVADALRAKGGTYISAQFTLVPGPGGEPLIAPHLKKLRPFLGKGDFAPGAFGHTLVDALAPADYVVEKVAYSALYQTRLEYILRALGIDTLIIGGIVTNGGVASAPCATPISATSTPSFSATAAPPSNRRCTRRRSSPSERSPTS
jgi:ureidoacrylate peracid hydrolase